MLGGVDRDWVFKILIALLKQDASALMQLSLSIASYAPSYSRLSAELIQLLHQIAMTQVVNSNFSLPAEHQQMLMRFCQLMSPEDVQLYYQIVLTARKDLPYADDEQAAFDMMLLRLLAFKPVANSQELPDVTRGMTADSSSINLDELALADVMPLANEDTLAADNVGEVKSTAHEHSGVTLTEETHTVDSSMINTESVESIASNVDEGEYQENYANEEQTLSTSSDEDIGNFSDENEALSQEMLAIEQEANAFVQTKPEADFLAQPSISGENVADTPVDSSLIHSNEIPEKVDEKKPYASNVTAAIETRNMLRSRKKSMEEGVKKSNGADMRLPLDKAGQSNVDAVENITLDKPNVPDLATLPEQPYTEDVINPATIKLANQVDKWAHMIDSMSLIARLRQLAIHATIDEKSTEDLLILQLDKSIRHLNSDAAHKQLEVHISEYLQRKVTVELNIVEKTVADPYQIQSDINAKRYEYAKQVLAEDEIVIALQQQFQAELDQETVVAR
jgi:DNA polymerase-3 subunit gamma/tau